MDKRRMFSEEVIETDWFTDMPATAQMLYVHLSMQADDDGFVTKTKLAIMNAHASPDDLKILVAKSYVIQLEGGLYLIKHWRMNNYIRNDRKKASPYSDRLTNFDIKPDGSYTEKKAIDNQLTTNCQPTANQVTAKCQRSIAKHSIAKQSIAEPSEAKPSEAINPRMSAFEDEKRRQLGILEKEMGMDVGETPNPDDQPF